MTIPTYEEAKKAKEVLIAYLEREYKKKKTWKAEANLIWVEEALKFLD